MTHEGGCYCGAIRYRLEGLPTSSNFCHCRMCQRLSGAPVVSWVTFSNSHVTFLKGDPKWFRSSNIATRAFCPNCGTHLLWRADRGGNEVDITTASLDDPNSFRPKEHIWTESQLDWMNIDDQLPRYRRTKSEG